MKELRILRVILYPMAAVLQFFVVPSPWAALVVAVGLLVVAALNLRRLLEGR